MRFSLIISLFTLSSLSLSSCKASFPVFFLSNESSIEIYVDGEYTGRSDKGNLVEYVVPKGVERISVSCRNNGVEIYSRPYNVKGMANHIFEIQIPKDYMYSSSPIQIKSK